MVDETQTAQWARDPWASATTAAASAVLTLLAFRWAFFDQSAGSMLQIALQILVPLPVAVGLTVCLARLREGQLWLLPAAGFAAATPAILLAWVKPPHNPEGGCSARGFLPMGVSYLFEGYGMWGMPLVALASLLVGLALVFWRPGRPAGVWLVIAGIAQAGAMMTSWTCIGE